MTIPDHCPDCGSRNFQVRYDYQAVVKHLWVCSNCYYTIDLEKYNVWADKESISDNNE